MGGPKLNHFAPLWIKLLPLAFVVLVAVGLLLDRPWESNDPGSEPNPAGLPTSAPNRGQMEMQALVPKVAAAIQDVAPRLLKMTDHPGHEPTGTSCGLSERLRTVFVCSLESRTPRGRIAPPIPLAATRWRHGVNVVPITEVAADACRSTLNCPANGSGIFVSVEN